MTKTLEGKVLWFSRHMGYGFIKSGELPEMYFHWSSLMMEGYKKIKEGTRVKFEPVWTRLGPAAKRVTRVKCED